jgi:hypothetical protein
MLAVAISAISTVAFLSHLPAAEAQTFHYFASGIESSGSPNYTAVRMWRQDKPVAGLPLTGCSQPLTGSPLYQTMWLKLNGGTTLELGTGHQCGDQYRYRFYAFYLTDGSWYPLAWDFSIPNGVAHMFKIKRETNANGDSFYKYLLDDIEKASLYSHNQAHEGTAILESYSATANVQLTMSELAVQRNETPWTPWTGRDGQNVDAAFMCGYWIADDKWRAGEPAGSC